MATRARVLIYQGDDDALDRQLGQSLPIGRKKFGSPTKRLSITTIDVPYSLLLYVAQQIVQDEEQPLDAVDIPAEL